MSAALSSSDRNATHSARSTESVCAESMLSGEYTSQDRRPQLAKCRRVGPPNPSLQPIQNLIMFQDVCEQDRARSEFKSSSDLTFAELPQLANLNSDAQGVNLSLRRNGNMVILEHKNGYHSLIAGLKKIDTVVGQTVSAGEPLGFLDRGGEGRKPSVYYELRRNGEPVNPALKFADLG